MPSVPSGRLPSLFSLLLGAFRQLQENFLQRPSASFQGQNRHFLFRQGIKQPFPHILSCALTNFGNSKCFISGIFSLAFHWKGLSKHSMKVILIVGIICLIVAGVTLLLSGWHQLSGEGAYWLSLL